MRRRTRFLEVVVPSIDQEIEQVQRRLAKLAERKQAALHEVEKIDFLTPAGRYERSRESALAARGFKPFSSFETGEQASKGRGRPRKYGADTPPPPRASRAKTPAGQERARLGLNRRTSRREITGTVSKVTVSSVTSSSARISVPKLAPEIGRTLLESTIAGSRGVDVIEPEAIQIDVAISDTSISVETKVEPTLSEVVPAPAKSVVDETDFVERPLPSFLARPLGFDQEYQDELDAADLAEARERHFLRFMDGRIWERGDHGAFKHDYDFTDPQSAPAEVKDAFKGFGLSTVSPTYNEENPDQSMKDEDVLKWLYVKYLNDEDEMTLEEVDEMLKDGLRNYRGAMGVYRTFKMMIEPWIEEERIRIRVWPLVEERLWSVEFHHWCYKTGQIDNP